MMMYKVTSSHWLLSVWWVHIMYLFHGVSGVVAKCTEIRDLYRRWTGNYLRLGFLNVGVVGSLVVNGVVDGGLGYERVLVVFGHWLIIVSRINSGSILYLWLSGWFRLDVWLLMMQNWTFSAS